MSFISMDLLGLYNEMENGIQYALTEDVINAY